MLVRPKQFFAHAVRQDYFKVNPFGDMCGLSVRPNRERDYYITIEECRRLLDVQPTPEWRALFCLGRFAGLRIPSEVVDLSWHDVNWQHNLLAIRSTKTKREGGGFRQVPMCPEVQRALLELAEKARPGSNYLFPEFRQRAQGPRGLRNVNLRTQLERYILKAGLRLWPKLFSNLRRSTAIDWAMRFPAFAVCGWMGHNEAVSQAFYLRITPELQTQATQYARLDVGDKVAHFPAQQIAEWPSILQKLPNPPGQQCIYLQCLKTPFCSTHPPKVPAAGFEPAT